MIDQVTSILIGFCVLASALLLLAYAFFLKQMRKSTLAIVSCAVLLGGLCALQLAHLHYLESGADLLASRTYSILLLVLPVAFYFFSTAVLMPERSRSVPAVTHLLPLLAGLFLPVSVIAPIAFAIGTGYSLWFAGVIYRLRADRPKFAFEMFFFGLFALLAIVILVLGVSIPYIDHRVFYLSYANATGVCLFLVVAALVAFPELLTDISDAAQVTYASSTLSGVDTDAALARLNQLMAEDKLFQDETLNLTSLASACELTPHQLSELINTSFAMGFSRYVRQHRVEEAKRLLRDDPTSSVLAIGLMTGFRSQSAFYSAFRDATGVPPGRYRKSLPQP